MTMDPGNLDDLTARLVALTKDLILFPSSGSRPADRERCFQFIKNHLDAIDHVRILEYRSDGFPSLVALPDGVREPEVLLCGHLDVVQHPAADDYIASIDDGRIHGVGAGDMKGQLAILLEVFREVHHRHPDISLGLAVTSDEEIGGEHGLRFLVEEVGLRCGLAMIPDGGSLNEIPVEEKGVLHAEVISRGHAAHAARPWLTENPLERLAARLLKVLAHFESLRTGDEHWYPTCAVTLIRTPNESINRIPDLAQAILDVRFPPPYTVEKILADIDRILGEDVELRPIIHATPTHLSPDPLYVEITERVTGNPVSFIREAGGSDARYLCQLGIPVILSRPLVGNLHDTDEWIDIRSMLTFYRIYEQYLTEKLASPSSR